jgi:phytoene dehydrogenase-like protein
MNDSTTSNTHYDIIIIGSGAGGLTAALCLAKAGQKVLVLEQHDVPGGWCHSFYLDGHRFSPGVHYIGLLGEGQSTRRLYESLGIADDLVFFRMNPEGYEHCWIGDERIDLPASFDKLNSTLIARFPHEEQGIKDYLELVRNVSKELMLIPKVRGFWQHVVIPFKTKNFGRNALKKLDKVIDRYIQDPVLKAALNIQFGDHGVAPSRTPFPLQCAVMDHYFDGGYYPMGGGAGIVKAMTNALKKNNGEIRTSQGVSRILISEEKKKKAIGVLLENGEKIFANTIISNADPEKTYLDMVGEAHLPSSFVKKLNASKYSCTSLMLFLTVDMDLRKEGIDSGNIWLMRNADLDGIAEELLEENIEEGHDFPGMFISCTTLKDPSSYDGRYHCLEVITFIDYAPFERFNEEELERSDEYISFKEKLTEKMLNGLEKVIPGVRNHIVHSDLGTPITNEHYINSSRGSVYGLEKTLNQLGPFAFKAKSPIQDLYLCGASIHSHGVAGASYSGMNTAADILEIEADELLHSTAETGQIRIYEAEDQSDYPEWLLAKMKVKRDRQEEKSLA